jgi:hypothetical protein
MRIFYKVWIFFLILIVVPKAHAAQDSTSLKTIDSLSNTLPLVQGDARFENLVQLGIEYAIIKDSLNSLTFLHESRALATTLVDSAKMVRSERLIGEVLRMNEHNEAALQALTFALGVAKRHKLLKDVKKILNSLGLIYSLQIKFDKALECFYESLTIRESEGNKPEISVP